MKRTPEQEAARKERSRREATYNRCASCNNVAGVGQTHCGACRPTIERAEEMTDRLNAIRDMARQGLHSVALLEIVNILEEMQP